MDNLFNQFLHIGDKFYLFILIWKIRRMFYKIEHATGYNKS